MYEWELRNKENISTSLFKMLSIKYLYTLLLCMFSLCVSVEGFLCPSTSTYVYHRPLHQNRRPESFIYVRQEYFPIYSKYNNKNKDQGQNTDQNIFMQHRAINEIELSIENLPERSSSSYSISNRFMNIRDTLLKGILKSFAIYITCINLCSPTLAVQSETNFGMSGFFANKEENDGNEVQEQQNQRTSNEESDDNIFEEVFILSKKFYIDRTYNHHENWDEIHDKLAQSVSKDNKKSQITATRKLLGMLGDKYTKLVSKEQYNVLKKFDPIGAGFLISGNTDGYYTVSTQPTEDTPAYKSGIEKGDKILKINGIDIKGKSIFDVIELITEGDLDFLKLTYINSKTSSLKETTLPRNFDNVVDPVTYSMNLRESDGSLVGYIRIKEFNSKAKIATQKALMALENQGVQEYILDLRGNPGGSVQSAVAVAGLFMPDKVVTYIEDYAGKVMPLKSNNDNVVTRDPLVIWADKRSASASEILASALQENCRGIVMAEENTFGKGLVQGVFGLSDGRGLVMTVAKYQTPKGNEIQKIGIAPDVIRKLPKKMNFMVGDPASDISTLTEEDFAIAANQNKLCIPPSKELIESKIVN